jgi:hypothetical protein
VLCARSAREPLLSGKSAEISLLANPLLRDHPRRSRLHVVGDEAQGRNGAPCSFPPLVIRLTGCDVNLLSTRLTQSVLLWAITG